MSGHIHTRYRSMGAMEESRRLIRCQLAAGQNVHYYTKKKLSHEALMHAIGNPDFPVDIEEMYFTPNPRPKYDLNSIEGGIIGFEYFEKKFTGYSITKKKVKGIDISKLTIEDIGRKVVYQASPNAKFEEGRITSFNDRFIFVDYTNAGRGQATPAANLEFINPPCKELNAS